MEGGEASGASSDIGVAAVKNARWRLSHASVSDRGVGEMYDALSMKSR
jgi:hypothetical protein